jgi:hypothetical protein
MDDEHKSHSVRKSGRKADKKASKNGKSGTSNNIKAFAITSVNKTRRRVVHALDKYVAEFDGHTCT